MFSYEDRCIYRRSPLIEVICQLRFPAILRIDAQAPAQFQEAIRGARCFAQAAGAVYQSLVTG